MIRFINWGWIFRFQSMLGSYSACSWLEKFLFIKSKFWKWHFLSILITLKFGPKVHHADCIDINHQTFSYSYIRLTVRTFDLALDSLVRTGNLCICSIPLHALPTVRNLPFWFSHLPGPFNCIFLFFHSFFWHKEKCDINSKSKFYLWFGELFLLLSA